MGYVEVLKILTVLAAVVTVLPANAAVSVNV